jgi:transposase-like protein
MKKELTAEQVIGKLREAEVLLGQGITVGEVSRKLGITEQTYYRWRQEYGGLKKLVTDLTLDNAILIEATRGNF